MGKKVDVTLITRPFTDCQNEKEKRGANAPIGKCCFYGYLSHICLTSYLLISTYLARTLDASFLTCDVTKQDGSGGTEQSQGFPLALFDRYNREYKWQICNKKGV